MRRIRTIGAIAAACGLAYALGLHTADRGAAQAAPRQDDEMAQKMMEGWTKYTTPGPMHERLAKRAGNWNAEVRMWDAPGLEPQTMNGTSRVEAMWENRYLVEYFEGEFMGQPFHGVGISGYDNFKGTFFGLWMDNFSTGYMASTGTLSADGKTLSFKGQAPDFLKQSYKASRSVEESIDDDTFVVKMWDTTPDGTEFMNMQITYRRAK